MRATPEKMEFISADPVFPYGEESSSEGKQRRRLGSLVSAASEASGPLDRRQLEQLGRGEVW
jgi:hypothetical protein